MNNEITINKRNIYILEFIYLNQYIIYKNHLYEIIMN